MLRNFIKDKLLFFDETADKTNDYFNESTIITGFEYWIRNTIRFENKELINIGNEVMKEIGLGNSLKYNSDLK
jgi:hypothetical protein